MQAGPCNPSWTWEITKLDLGMRVGALESVEANVDPKVVAFNVTNIKLDIINFTKLILQCVSYVLWWWLDWLMINAFCYKQLMILVYGSRSWN